MGRTELLRINDLAYKHLEKAGAFFVVADLCTKYRQPAKYDQKLQMETIYSAVTVSKIEHTYKLTRRYDGAIIA